MARHIYVRNMSDNHAVVINGEIANTVKTRTPTTTASGSPLVNTGTGVVVETEKNTRYRARG